MNKRYKVGCSVHGVHISPHNYCVKCFDAKMIPDDVMMMMKEDERSTE